MRLGIYSDDVFRREGEALFTDRAFIHFVAQLPPRIDEVVLFGRLDPEPGRGPYQLPGRPVRVVGLPHYKSVRAVPALVRSLRKAHRIFAEELQRLDAVLVFGPHPIAFLFALTARRRHVSVVLGVRQDFPTYVRCRLPGRRWLWAVWAANAMEQAWRALSQTHPTVAVGHELGRNYSSPGTPRLITEFSLVPRAAAVPLADAQAREWVEPLRLLTVSRLDSEKNPLLLVEILAGLRKSRDWHLTVVGSGPLADALERQAVKLGVREAVELIGYVASGPELWAHYQQAHAFLHVSLTEGVPQVLLEAQAAGIPVVATAVGGVGPALGGGESGILIPPGDARAAVAALEQLAVEPELRRGLIAAGHDRAKHGTLERQLDELAAFVRGVSRACRSNPSSPTAPGSTSVEVVERP